MRKIMEMLPLMLLSFSCLPTVKCDLDWLKSLPDSQKINTLAFVGTHDTAAYRSSFMYERTQFIPITPQLDIGIRVFDMRVRRNSNVFAMHHHSLYLNMMFSDLVTDVHAYLQKFPKEFVIMLMQEEYTAEGSTLSECEILENRYLKGYPNLFVKHWSIEDTIGQHRGKILLARANRGFSGCVTQLPCKEQNQWGLTFQYGRAEKSNEIRALQAEVSNTTHNYECYINFLSANGGSTYTPQSIALDRWILPRPFGDGDNITAPGMNELMLDIFHNPRNTLYIIMADFPGLQLIIKVHNSNNGNSVGYYFK